MSSLLITLILTFLHSFLFYGNQLGLSVIIFIIPLLVFIIYTLKKKDLIKNKKGLLFLIPIILLSLTYLIFNNEFFYYTNIIVIPILLILMFIFTIKPSFDLRILLNNFFNIIVEPFTKMPVVLEDSKNSIIKNKHMSDKTKQIIKSCLIILPIVIIVLLLLAGADMIFNSLIDSILKVPKEFFENFNLTDFISRLIRMFIVFLYLSATIYFLKDNFLTTSTNIKETKQKDNKTIIMLLIVLNIIYIIFDIIQIKSLMLRSLPSGITYATYARQGFFQLMFVSFINIIIILIAKNHNQKTSKQINILSIVMIFLTFIIIISSILRMNLYEAAYGYTLLRLLVYIILFTEIILIIPLIIYIIKDKFNIVKWVIIIVITIYTFINFINLDSMIAKRNIERYYKTHKIDIEYLENYRTDNINDLTNFYQKTKDKKIKTSLHFYFENLDTDYKKVEFNISKYNAKEKLKPYINKTIKRKKELDRL